MFSYYGSKGKLVKKYPSPEYDTIIEPFAGSARYALMYYNKSVILNDLYKVVADIWEYIISASIDDINNIPNLKKGDDIRDLDIPDIEKNLLGFMVNLGVPYPHNVYTTWAAKGNEILKCKNRIIKMLPLIRHWTILNVDYKELKNIQATWFIDPPYQDGGQRYKKHDINYSELADWCKSRNGQVIVCESENADWLPFRQLCKTRGQKRSYNELVWTNA